MQKVSTGKGWNVMGVRPACLRPDGTLVTACAERR